MYAPSRMQILVAVSVRDFITLSRNLELILVGIGQDQSLVPLISHSRILRVHQQNFQYYSDVKRLKPLCAVGFL